jgi:carboxymethylenebutenolidase
MTGTSRLTTKVRSGDREIDCHVALPAGRKGKGPAVVVIHEIFGADPHIQDVAARFAAQGYVAVAPNLFSGPLMELLTPANIGLAMQAFASAPPASRSDPQVFASWVATQPDDKRPILEAFVKVRNPAALEGYARDLLAVTTWLRSRSDVDPARIGSVGFCFGGGMSALLATVDPKLKAAIIFYGQNPPLEKVPNIHAAMLGLYGQEDPQITGAVPQLDEAMRKAGKTFSYHVYPGAKHAFFNDTRPMYHKESAIDAWSRVLAFFAQELGPLGK